ncbi:MAG TPA: hypothetical protein VGJ69_13665 [Pyrinomonadaceae bacterium]|jgi:hypothetical protein
MKYERTIRLSLAAIMTMTIGGSAIVCAQDQASKPTVSVRKGGRDPFKKYVPVVKPPKSTTKLDAPSIKERIERYRAQKLAAAAAHVPPPKPTTALLLNEMQVTGIFRTPRGWAAMVEATPIKLSYVIYPGETFFDGQLVAIEESRLVFRRDVIWLDGRREKSVEIKPLRKPSPVEDMADKAAPANAPVPEAPKSSAPEKQ